MTLTPRRKEKEADAVRNEPTISYSKLNRYDTCPRQYQYHYIQGYRPKYEDADRAFGSAVHWALAEHFRSDQDPVGLFTAEWEKAKHQPLDYTKRESWWDFRQKGKALLAKFMAEERTKIAKVRAVEKQFELTITNIPRPIIGLIDLVAEVEGVLTVIDFKTVSQRPSRWEAALTDQLSTYQLAEPDVEQVGLCVFIKTKEPQIEWLFARRQLSDVREYLDKVDWMIGQIDQGVFHRRSGKHCDWCDYRAVCLKDEENVARTLVQITPASRTV